MRKKILIAIIAITSLILAISIGSVNISPANVLNIIISKITGAKIDASISPITSSILLNIRLPRVLIAFSVGALLSVSGSICQAVLQNPLASSYTLGVSSGATLGASIIITLGITASWILPLGSFVFGLVTVLLAITFAETSQEHPKTTL